MTTCLQCLGTGLISDSQVCPVCGGSGQTPEPESLTENYIPTMEDTNTVVTPEVEAPVAAPASDEPEVAVEVPAEAPAEEVAPAVAE